ncbi:stalk domain-containing protein [Cohnella caldifontis]|uniref:stalk domain-containing protein n=1 Tax=Cohnella caldifontis TaxID=3027471 RepID=UPI0023EDE450|nr:DUF4163 domain-containing protein [Cohnella sp. YIM B05605]
MRRNRSFFAREKSKKPPLAAVLAAAAIAIATQLADTGAHRAAAAEAFKVIDQPIRVEGVSSTIPAINVEGSTYVGLRVLNEKLGLTTEWDESAKKITVLGNGRTLVLKLKTGETTLNDQSIHGLPTVNQDGWTYLPLRFLMERMGYGVDYDPATRRIEIGKIAENAATIATAKIAESRDKPELSLEVNYPVLSGLADPAVQDKINAFLKSEAESHASSGKFVLERAVADMEGGPDEAIRPVSFQGSYYVTYNENNRLSLYVDYYQYTGGAHGITVRVPYAFDLATGEKLTLQEAAGGNPGYVKIINAEISKQIKARNVPMLTPFVTIKPNQPFYLTHEGLSIFFQQYEYTPYAAGIPEFRIPYTAFG